MKKIKIISAIIFITLFNCSCKSISPEHDKLKTKVLWAESYLGHYTNSEDTMLKGIGGFVSYINPKDTVTKDNYLEAYYEINKNAYRNIDIYNKLSNLDYIKNDSLFSVFSLENENNTKVKRKNYNKIWEYKLTMVTFKEYYLGLIEQYVPKFESSKNLPNLKYEKIKIPTYIIKIISLKPYEEEE
ncbi:hypothetical protein INQ45_06585 [Flavobacterium columnare]|uniref:hypothetical protein n=1 Tax=Flavobacterium columnare TaxID=996 RepID=UPI002D20BF10|nr:hypothetical protein [Flavobacterium columnare]MEB3800747.1 hypothetical protein [Flavobacterium columnare]